MIENASANRTPATVRNERESFMDTPLMFLRNPTTAACIDRPVAKHHGTLAGRSRAQNRLDAGQHRDRRNDGGIGALGSLYDQGIAGLQVVDLKRGNAFQHLREISAPAPAAALTPALRRARTGA